MSFLRLDKRMFRFVHVFFIALSLRTVKSDEPVYSAVGDEVVLKPGPVQGPITDITWKHGQDIAIEWYQGPVEGYRQFKERGSLNVTTGALTITGLTPGESGSYTAEINNKVTSTTQLLVISRVSKPTVSTQCDADHCVFTCESNDTTAEPVTYSWMAEDKSWTSTKEITITNDESEKQFHCELRNPVSTEMSESVHNPFTTWKWYNTVLIICFILLIGGLIFFIGFILYKWKRIKGNWYNRVGIIYPNLLIGGFMCFVSFIVFIFVKRDRIKEDGYYIALIIVSILVIDGLFIFTVFISYKRNQKTEDWYNRVGIFKSLMFICLLIFFNFIIRITREETWFYDVPIYGSTLLICGLIFLIFYKKNKKGKWYYRVLTYGSIVLICPLFIFILCNRITGKGEWYYDFLSLGSTLVISVLLFFIFKKKNKKESFVDSSPIYYQRQQISGENADNPAPGSEPPEGSNHGPATNGPSETKPENVVSEVEGSMNHVPTPTAPLDNSEERVMSEPLMGSSGDPESDVSSETSRKDETILEVTPVQVHTNQTASKDTVNEMEVPGGSNQDPTSDAAPESSSEPDIGASPDQVLTDATNEGV